MKIKFETVVQLFMGALFALVLGFALFGDRSNCGVDRETLACRVTGSFADILGLVIIGAGYAWLSGFADWVGSKLVGKSVYLYGKRNDGAVNGLIGLGITAVGFILVWIN